MNQTQNPAQNRAATKNHQINVALNHQASTFSQVYSHQVNTDDELESTFELIKLLRQFEQSDRWTLLIAPENLPDKSLLNGCAVDMDRVLVIHEKQTQSIQNSIEDTIETALSHATCSAVIAWCHNISQPRLSEINRLGEKSQCHFYAFNKHNGPLSCSH